MIFLNRSFHISHAADTIARRVWNLGGKLNKRMALIWNFVLGVSKRVQFPVAIAHICVEHLRNLAGICRLHMPFSYYQGVQLRFHSLCNSILTHKSLPRDISLQFKCRCLRISGAITLKIFIKFSYLVLLKIHYLLEI